MTQAIPRSTGRLVRIVPALTLVVSACATSAAQTRTPSPPPAAVDGLARLREATRPFRNLDSAVAAGYPRTVAACLVHEHHGAMGYHHVNSKYVDGKLDVARPQILLYERLSGGEYRLNGVEFIVPYRFWSRDSTPPVLMGQRLKREDNLMFWYLHAWAWSENADGVFADFNPAVACPADSKVFKPFERPPGN